MENQAIDYCEMPWEFLFHPGQGGEKEPGERGSIQETPRMVPGQLSDCILDGGGGIKAEASAEIFPSRGLP